MPDKSIAVVKSWMSRNVDFQAWIWVDSETYPGNEDGKAGPGMDGLKKFYSEKFSDYSEEKRCLGNIKDLNYGDVNKELRGELGEGYSVYDYIRYEIDRLRPNYGASSDLLRYSILYEHGGMYSDMDVIPNEVLNPMTNSLNSLNSHRAFESEQNHLCVFNNSQGTGQIGNDFFIATPKNHAMLEILKQCIKNYKRFRGSENRYSIPLKGFGIDQDYAARQAYEYDNAFYIYSITPALTGPSCVQVVLRSNAVIGCGLVETSFDSSLSAEIDYSEVSLFD